MYSNKKNFLLLVVFSTFCGSSYIFAQVPQIDPSTWSHRLDADGTTLNNWIVSGNYYGYPDGEMTSFNSSPFLEFSYHETANPGDPLYDWTHKMNFRLKFPEDYDPNDLSKEYPMMVFMHGAGERGDCWGNNCYGSANPRYYNNDHQLYHGGQKHLVAGQMKFFDGFILFPQNNSSWFWPDRFSTVDIIEELLEEYQIDAKKIYVHGLSNGGNASWQLISYRPDLFAAAVSESGKPAFGVGADPTGDLADPEKMLHIPTWHFQGSNDNNPSPAFSEANLSVLQSYGGTPKYTLLQGIGHGTWNIAHSWGEDRVRTNYIDTAKNEFFPWFLQYSKLTIHPYFGITEVCQGDPVNIRMGISPGFEAYEWKKIKNGSESTYASVSGMPNEIVTDEVAAYAVRYQQNGDWTEWSEPLNITTKPRPTVNIVATGSTYFPSPDNANNVLLQTSATAESYQWYKDGNAIASNGIEPVLFVDQNSTGKYHLVISEDGQCNSIPSNPIYVRKETYSGIIPALPVGLTALPDTEKSIVLIWEDQEVEDGFELFRASSSGGPYSFVKRLAESTIYYKDEPLSGNSTYYYLLRSFNENGASASTSEVSVTTLDDTQPPSAPILSFDAFGYTEQRSNPDPTVPAVEYFDTNLDEAKLSWTASTDNAGVQEYRLYFSNGTLVGTTTDTNYLVGGLEEQKNYQFYVEAVDISGNVSTQSNKINVNTIFDGLYFHLYAGNTWKVVQDFSVDSYWHEQGSVDNFDISIRSDYYGDSDYFAFDFFGFIYIEDAGDHTFYTKSDDGSQLFIDSIMVVNNDGRHGAKEESGTINLSQGPHYITGKFFEATGGQRFDVKWTPPGGSKGFIPNSVLRSYDTYTTGNPPLAASNLTVSQTVPDPEPNTIFGLDLTWDHNNPVDVVVLGSSTAVGTGASTPSNSWVGLFTSWLQDINTTSTVTNLAVGGYTSYHVREDGYSASGKPSPDTNSNITAALNIPGVDMIIVNLPSNDLASGYSESETMTNLMAVRDLAGANGVQIFFTTTQPRTQFVLSKRQELATKAESIRIEFKEYTIDIFDELTDFNDYTIKSTYHAGDLIHLNDAGHYYIFNETVATLSPFLTSFEIYRGNNSGSGKEVVKTSLELSYTDLNLDPSSTYYYQIKAVNVFGSTAFSSEVSGTTVADASVPTVPSGLNVLTFNDHSVVLNWASSTDNVGVAGYTINVDGTPYQSSAASGRKAIDSKMGKSSSNQKGEGQASTSALVTGLEAGTEYSFTVSAFDGVPLNSASSDPITQATSGNPALPIELVEFYAVKNDNGIEILWHTASEINNDYFTIERSGILLDFEVLGTVIGAGDSKSLLKYQFVDDNPLSNNYYRLKQTDFDGNYEYSNIIKVEFEGDSEWTVYPNPTVAGNVNLLITNKKGNTTINVKIINMYGKIVFNQNFDIEAQSTFSYQLDLPQGMSTGIYNLILKESGRTVNRKLVLE